MEEKPAQDRLFDGIGPSSDDARDTVRLLPVETVERLGRLEIEQKNAHHRRLIEILVLLIWLGGLLTFLILGSYDKDYDPAKTWAGSVGPVATYMLAKKSGGDNADRSPPR